MNEVKHLRRRSGILVAVALKYAVLFKRVLNCNERYIGSVFTANKENERLLTYHTLVVVHTPNAVVQVVALAYKVLRCPRYHYDICVF